MFGRSQENRPLDLKKHRRLVESMKTYGFLRCFPIVCFRSDKGNLVVKDGQHRLAIAESLGLTVHWIEETVDFDVAVINCTSKTWVLKDYAQKFAANGKADYQRGLAPQFEFVAHAEKHGFPIGPAFALLAGTTGITNVWESFVGGTFKVKDEKWANAVAGIYGPMLAMSSALDTARFLEACMAVCRVREFDTDRLLHNAAKCREKLVAYSNRDAFLDMLEEVYNFGRSKLVGLRTAAIMAMRERNACKPRKARQPEQKVA